MRVLASDVVRGVLGAGVLIAATLLAFWPVLDSPFMSDDHIQIVQNAAMKNSSPWAFWTDSASSYQFYPLTYTALWLHVQAHGLWPRGFHIVNIALHVISAGLVWVLLWQLRVPGALVAAVLFAVHPTNVSSLAWVIERKNTQSLMFALAALMVLVHAAGLGSRSPSRQRVWLWGAAGWFLFVLAMLSKTALVGLPGVLLVLIWWKRGRLTRADWLLATPLFVTALAFAVVTYLAEFGRGNVGEVYIPTRWDGILISGRTLLWYVKQTLWPFPLTMFYPRLDPADRWAGALAVTAVLCLFAALWVTRHRIGRGPLAVAVIFAGVLLPMLGLFPTGLHRFTFVADHWLYPGLIPLIAGVTAAFVPLVRDARTRPRTARLLAGGGVVMLVAVCCVLARYNARAWSSGVAFFAEAVRVHPNNAELHAALAFELQFAGREDEALYHAYRAHQLGEPDAAVLWLIAENELRRGHLKQAEWADRLAFETDPNFPTAQHNLGWQYAQEGKWELAEEALRRAVRLNTHPRVVRRYYHRPDAEYPLNLAVVLNQVGKHAEAAEFAQQALDMGLGNELLIGKANFHLATALEQTGELARAVVPAERAAELAPQSPGAQALLRRIRDRAATQPARSE